MKLLLVKYHVWSSVAIPFHLCSACNMPCPNHENVYLFSHLVEQMGVIQSTKVLALWRSFLVIDTFKQCRWFMENTWYTNPFLPVNSENRFIMNFLQKIKSWELSSLQRIIDRRCVKQMFRFSGYFSPCHPFSPWRSSQLSFSFWESTSVGWWIKIIFGEHRIEGLRKKPSRGHVSIRQSFDAFVI